MVVRDESTPQCSGRGWKVEAANTRLAVLVVDAVEALYEELGVPKGKSLACTAGPVDREEAYGYLMADVMGSALLEALGARYVGERVRKRSAQHVVVLPEAKKQAKRQAKREALKAGSDPDVAASKAAEDLESGLLAAVFDPQLPLSSPPPLLKPRPSQKRKREPADQRSEWDVPSCEDQLAVLRSAQTAHIEAFKAQIMMLTVTNAALDASARAESQLEAAVELVLAEDGWDDFILSKSESKRLDLLDAQRERAEEKVRVKTAEADAALEADVAAEAAKVAAEDSLNRIREWIRYPDVVTPFPWPGEVYILPCNLDDLDYYETCPRGYPPGIREWKERWYEHHRAIGLPLD